MNKKSLWVVVVVLVIIAALAAYAANYKGLSLSPAPTGTSTLNQTPASANPNAPGMPVPGSFVSATATGITVKVQDGTIKTFTVSANTPIISTVQAGVVAGGLSSIKAGAPVMVIPSKTDGTVAANVQLITPSPTPSALPAGSTFTSLSGPELSHTATSMVVMDQAANAKITIAITKNTFVLSNVSAGQKGKDLSYLTDGSSYVYVNAVKTGSTYTANSIQILIPIAQITGQ